MSAAAGSSGKQPTTGLLSAMASLVLGKSKTERKSSGRSRSRQDTLPRSFGINRTNSERVDRPKPADIARRNSDSVLEQPEHGDHAGAEDDDEEMDAEGRELAPKATVGLKGTTLTDMELGFPAVYIINYWKQKEERKFAARMSDMNEPPLDYAPHRRYMVDWISEVGEQLSLQTVTIHSAVSFLDELMVLMNYSHRDWRLYAVCCLSVAAKYEEAECNMPMISELAEATEMNLNTPIVTRGELELVQRLQWDVSRVTAMHFLGYYTSQGVTMTEDTCQGRRLVDKVVVYMKKYVDFYANLCQQDYQFQRYRPSHIAAASILAARRALCIMPVWRDELTELTGYTLADIVECGEELWNFYEKMFPTHKPLRTDPNASAAAAALKRAEQVAAAAAAAAASAAAAGVAPSSGSDRAVVTTSNASLGTDDVDYHGVNGVIASSAGDLRA